MGILAWIPVSVYTIIVMSFMGVYTYRQVETDVSSQVLFAVLVWLTIIGLAGDMIARLVDLQVFKSLIIEGATYIKYVVPPFIGVVWFFYISSMITERQPALTYIFDIIVVLAAVVSAALVFTTPLTSWLFIFDEEGLYHRGPFYYVPAAMMIVLVLAAEAYVALSHRTLNGQLFRALLAFPAPIIIGAIAQMYYQGMPWMLLGVSLSVLLIFVNTQTMNMNMDYLTRVFNRKKLDSELELAVERAHAGDLFSGMMVDIDKFKDINDTYGHAVGDMAIIETARLLRRCVRVEDMIARFGGDEFFILLNTDKPESLDIIAQRIDNQALEFNRGSSTYQLSLSKGYAVFDPSVFASVTEFERHIDELMYADKMKRREAMRGQAQRVERRK